MIDKLFEKSSQLFATFSRDTFPQDLSSLTRTAGLGKKRFLGFNSQFLRASTLIKLLKVLPLDAFVETGTCMGATSFLVAAQTKLRVFTCEANPQFYRIARRRLRFLGSRVRIAHKDSREFLENTAHSGRVRQPFIYLDAHWYDDLPLLGELEFILKTFERFVVVIDDFRVPSDPGFGFDTYGGQCLDGAYIRPLLRRSGRKIDVFFPSYPSSMESGSQRGFVLLSCDGWSPCISSTIPKTLLEMAPPDHEDESR